MCIIALHDAGCVREHIGSLELTKQQARAELERCGATTAPNGRIVGGADGRPSSQGNAGGGLSLLR